jgi:hypothetical protein
MITAFFTAFVVAVIVSSLINGLMFRFIAFGVTLPWHLLRWDFLPVAKCMARREWCFAETNFPHPIPLVYPREINSSGK